MKAWKITKKDLLLLVRDWRTLLGLVALPLLFITILGLSAGQFFSEKEKAKKMRVGVVNEDGSTLADNLITEVLKLDALAVTELSNREQAKDMLADGKIEVLAIIGPRYHELVEKLDTGDLFFTDSGRLSGQLRSLDIEVQSGAFLISAAEIVEQLVFAFAVRTIAPDVLRAHDPQLAVKFFLKAKRQSHERQAGEAPAAVSVATKSRGDIIYEYLVPSYTVMFVFFIVQLMARSLIGERDSGTLNRLLSGPVTRTGLMVGKAVPFLLISIAQTIVLFLAGKFLFHMSWGMYPWMLLPVIAATSLAATALGLMVATAVRTDAQVSAYGNFLVLILAAVSGCLMPRAWEPELMQQAGLVAPHAWALIAYDHLLSREVPNLHVVWNCCLALVGFAFSFFTVAWWRFRTLN
ncbi:MAG TPA: ABC transporter permease [Planctomycetaceae bacterium]|jgi:ABC-2 type transport system permease protein